MERRRELINKIKATFIKNPSGYFDKQKFVAELCLTHGSTRKKAEEYIKDLIIAGFIVEEEQGLILSEEEFMKLNYFERKTDEFLKGVKENGNKRSKEG